MRKLLSVILLVIMVSASLGACTTNVSFGSSDVDPVGFSRSIDKETGKPVNKTSSFTQEDKIFYYVVKLNYVPAGTSIKSSFYFGKQHIADAAPTVLDGPAKNTYYQCNLKLTNTVSPKGTYKVIVKGTKNGKTKFEITDTFKIK